MEKNRKTVKRQRLGYLVNVFFGSNDAWCFWVFVPTSEALAVGTASTIDGANLAADRFIDEDYKRKKSLLNEARKEEGLPYVVNPVWEEDGSQEGSPNATKGRVYFNHR